MNYKEALKEGFFELQSARDWYREVTTTPLEAGSNQVIGMHADLVEIYMRTAALLVQPIAPHFAEHLYCTILGSPRSVQHALWSDIPVVNPSPEDLKRQAGAFEAGLYMRATVKSVRDAEVLLAKKSKKGAASASAAVGAKSVRLIVATSFPPWQDTCVGVIKGLLGESTNAVNLDDGKLKEALSSRGLLKDKRVMPFVQTLKVRHCLSFSASRTADSLHFRSEITRKFARCPLFLFFILGLIVPWARDYFFLGPGPRKRIL
jgi:leucyl-tRNA synthetase